MKLRKKQSYLHSVPDGVPQRRKGPSMFRWVYFGLLIFIVLCIIYYIVKNSFLFVYGSGQIALEKYYVQAKAPCEVIEYLVKEKDEVSEGAELVKIAYLPDKSDLDNEVSIEREIRVLKNEIRKKEEDMQESILFRSIRKEKNSDNTSLSRMRKLYYMAKNDVDDLRLKLNILEAKKSAFEIRDSKASDFSSLDEQLMMPTVVHSKFNGYVFRITKRPYEYVDKGQNLMIIENPDTIMIYARFKNEYQKYITQDSSCIVEFPNGRKTKAKVYRIYTYSYFFGEKTEAREDVIAEMVPVNSNDNEYWKKYKGTDVEVRVERQNFGNSIINYLRGLYKRLL